MLSVFPTVTRQLFILPAICIVMLVGSSSCKVKYGCPSNGKNVGAERVLSGEKNLPKAKKFRV